MLLFIHKTQIYTSKRYILLLCKNVKSRTNGPSVSQPPSARSARVREAGKLVHSI